jgi:uncharacterized protein
MKHGLKESAVAEICAILSRYPQVEKAVLYGSRAKGSHKTGSDIDLTLVGNAGLNMNILYKVMEDLDELYLPYSFDLSIFKDIRDRDVLEHIRRVGIVFYKREEIKDPEPASGGDVRCA